MRQVRLEVEEGTSPRMLEILVRKLDLTGEDVYRVRASLGMAATMLAITSHMGTPGHYPWSEGDPSGLGLMSADPDTCSDVPRLLLCR